MQYATWLKPGFGVVLCVIVQVNLAAHAAVSVAWLFCTTGCITRYKYFVLPVRRIRAISISLCTTTKDLLFS